MLNVSDGDELMLQLGDLIPREPAFGIMEVERVDSIINQSIADLRIFQNLCTGVRFRDQRQCAVRVCRPGNAVLVLGVRLVTFPGPKGSLIRLKVQMPYEQGVVSDLPE